MVRRKGFARDRGACGDREGVWAPRYAAEIRTLAKKYEGRIRILCGVEADYVPGGATPDRRAYAAISPDYIIGSVHFVVAPDGARVYVDESPESLEDGIRRHFGGDAEAFLPSPLAPGRTINACA